MNIVEKIAVSDARSLIDKMLLEKRSCSDICREVADKHKLVFHPDDIESYGKEMFLRGNSTIHQVIKVVRDINANELPGNSEFEKLSMNFSFQKTNEDLDMLYDRIRQLKKLADANPEDASYDKRIKDHLAQAEAIRTRVFRHQYEHIRKAVLLSQGKKICLAAISVLMPYIPGVHKDEALKKFQSAIEPLLDAKAVPDRPDDIIDLDAAADESL